MNITYTFSADCPTEALRGVTFTGGELTRIKIGNQVVDAVAFKCPKINGQLVTARLDNKPDLQAIVAAAKEEAQRVADAKRAALETAVPGLAQYETAMRNYYNAQAAYDRASERGYPAKEAAAADAADKALQAVHEQYPATVAYREIDAFRLASNYDKSAAGDRAMRALEAGGNIFEVAETMRSEWKTAAERAMWNS